MTDNSDMGIVSGTKKLVAAVRQTGWVWDGHDWVVSIDSADEQEPTIADAPGRRVAVSLSMRDIDLTAADGAPVAAPSR